MADSEDGITFAQIKPSPSVMNRGVAVVQMTMAANHHNDSFLLCRAFLSKAEINLSQYCSASVAASREAVAGDCSTF